VTRVGCRRSEQRLLQAQQVILAHDPSQTLVVDLPTFAPQQRADPTVTVVTVGQSQALDNVAQRRLLPQSRCCSPTSNASSSSTGYASEGPAAHEMSSSSPPSENVKAEARWARRQGRLLQVYVEKCEPPLFFGERQGIDLHDWSGAAAAPPFPSLLKTIREALLTGPSGRPVGGAAALRPELLDVSSPTTEHRIEPSNLLSPGTVLNGLFLVRRLIAANRLGSVYEGANVTTDERVAIKVFSPTLASSAAMREAFLKEMRVLTRLNHPAIVQYRLAAREPTNGALYTVCDFYDGIMLDALVGHMTIAEDAVRALARRLAEGLRHAHEIGAINRQLAPDNILLPAGLLDRSRIIDFGVSDAFDPPWVPGNAALQPYAAPEQCRNPRGEIGPWTDVYSLGLVMLTLATGVAPAPDLTSAEEAGCRAATPDLSRAPPRLRSLLSRMLEFDPAKRLRSMDEVLVVLDQKPRRSRSRTVHTA